MLCYVSRLTIDTVTGGGCFKSGGFTRKFEFWSLREVLNVVLKVVGTWQRLASDTRLASSGRKSGQDSCSAKQQAQRSGFDSRKHFLETPIRRLRIPYRSKTLRDNRYKLYRLAWDMTLMFCLKFDTTLNL